MLFIKTLMNPLLLSYKKARTWTLVSNNLGLTSRRFTIRELQPQTLYEFKIRANNQAGSTENQFKVLTRSSEYVEQQQYDDYNFDENNQKQSSSASGDMGSNAAHDQLVLHQIQFIVPMVIGILLVVVVSTGVAVCIKRSTQNLII